MREVLRWTGSAPMRSFEGPECVQARSLRAEGREGGGTQTRKRGPGDRNRRRGAPRGAGPSQKGPPFEARKGGEGRLKWLRLSALHSLVALCRARGLAGRQAHPAPDKEHGRWRLTRCRQGIETGCPPKPVRAKAGA